MALQLPATLPVLEPVTGRFALRPFSPSDVAALATILAHGEIWSQGYGDGEHRPTSPDDLAAFIHRRYNCLASGAGRIEGDVDLRNQRSLASLTRFGFTVGGTRRRSSQRGDGSWRDVVILSLLAEEWPDTRQRAVTVLNGHTPAGLLAA